MNWAQIVMELVKIEVSIDFEINIVLKSYHNRKIGKGYE